MRSPLITTRVLSLILAGTLSAPLARAENAKILSIAFEPRISEKVDVGDFHFVPGQKAPIHTHVAPVVGYVSKGSIYYQIEGEAPVILKTGDAFYEPVGPRILHFDNASQTEEAVFTDFNVQRTGEPFIVFPEPLTEKIDRRTFPTVQLNGAAVDKVEAFAETIAAGGSSTSATRAWPVMAYLAEGELVIEITGEPARTIKPGQTFALPAGPIKAALINASRSQAVKVVTFNLMSSQTKLSATTK